MSRHSLRASPDTVRIGVAESLKHGSSIHCSELVSLPKAMVSRYVGRLSNSKTEELNQALAEALELDGL